MPPMPSIEDGAWRAADLAALGTLAALSIRAALGVTSAEGGGTGDADHARFDAPGASFVTLQQDGRLRGCIGTLLAHRALGLDVAANACAAALRDPRFAPLAVHELTRTEVEVSVLTAPSAMAFTREDDLLRQLRVGRDGLIVEHQGRRATYLPSVWQQLSEPRDFVRQLRRKAGIEDTVPMTALSVQRYETQHSLPRLLAVR